LKDLDRSRNDTRNRFRIDLPTDPDDPRPSLARSTVEDLVIDLFRAAREPQARSVVWLREAIAEGRLTKLRPRKLRARHSRIPRQT